MNKTIKGSLYDSLSLTRVIECKTLKYDRQVLFFFLGLKICQTSPKLTKMKSLWAPGNPPRKCCRSSHRGTNNHYHSCCGFKHNTECGVIFKSFNNLLKKECKSNRSLPPKWVCLIFKVMTDVTKILQTFFAIFLYICVHLVGNLTSLL